MFEHWRDRPPLLRVLAPAVVAEGVAGGFAMLIKHRHLAVSMARRDLVSRYRGQLMGTFWIIGHPASQMLLFVFLFGVVFKQRIGGTYDLPRDYTVYLLSGLVGWLSLIPALTASCGSVVTNSNLVKQFTFEVEILPIKEVLISMVFWFVGVPIILIYTLAAYGSLPWTYVLLPVVFATQVVMMIGFAWFLGGLAVFFRDIKDLMQVFVTLGMYIVPVVYLPAWVPDFFRPLIYINPLSYLIWIYQDTLYFGRIEHPWAWVISIVYALVVFGYGHLFFQRVKPLFGSAL